MPQDTNNIALDEPSSETLPSPKEIETGIASSMLTQLGEFYSSRAPTRLKNAVETAQNMQSRAKAAVGFASDAVRHPIATIREVVDHLDVEPHEHIPQSIRSKARVLQENVTARISSVQDGVASAHQKVASRVTQVHACLNSVQDQIANMTLGSIDRVDAAVEYILPEEQHVEKHKADEQICPEEQKPNITIPNHKEEDEVAAGVSIPALTAKSRKIAGKVSKRLQKRVWKQVASTQGFLQRNSEVIHTSLVDYATQVLDSTVPSEVRAVYSAMTLFSTSARETYAKLAGQQDVENVGGADFSSALQEAMGDSWTDSFRPAAFAYCEVVNRVLQARDLAFEKSKGLIENTNVFSNSYAVIANKSAVIFNHPATQNLRATALAYLKRINEAAEPPSNDSFLALSSSKIAAVISIAQNDVQGMCVHLYDPLAKRWNAEADFNFGVKLMSLVRDTPAKVWFYETYGYLQGVLNIKSIKALLAAGKANLTASAPAVIKPVVIEGAGPDGKLIDLMDITQEVCQKFPEDGNQTIEFDAFITAFRSTYEERIGEWNDTLLESARRMFNSHVKQPETEQPCAEVETVCEGSDCQEVGMHVQTSGIAADFGTDEQEVRSEKASDQE